LHSLAVADVAGAAGYSQPVSARIDSVSADGITSDLKQNLILPPNTRNITFRYNGTNLLMPERTRFRYRLDRLDQSWSVGASSRQVIFTPLSPGSYTFRIMASSAFGIWNGPETDIAFQVKPALWQTWYFRTLGVILALAIAVALYRFRLMQITGQLNRRYQDRLAERTRIARELHDTMLQGVIATELHLDLLQKDVSDDSPAGKKLQWLLKQMQQSAEEGRAALRGLRSVDNSVNIETAFERMVSELSASGTPESFVKVQGDPTPLNAIVFDEVYRIGREAYINSVTHASAKQIEIAVEYGVKSFLVRVNDDGRGIDDEILMHGRKEHWGLTGMRERAKSIGADLAIHTRNPGGSTIELCIPSGIAYSPADCDRIKWPWKTRKHNPVDGKKFL
jgi:signal transduction histidine kinase